MPEIVIRIQIPDNSTVATEQPSSSAAPVAAGSAPSCPHGPMYHKSGTNKSGKPYSGYFCKDDECTPIWDKR